MAVTIIATPGASNANSYELQSEADAYFAARLPLNPPWEDADDPTAALAMATRTLDAMGTPHKSVRRGCDCNYRYTSPAWTGAPTTSTQRLAWPRTGMYDRNGNPIPSDVIPQELKDAESELAGQLILSDTTLDNSASVQGIKSVTAGSVSISFKDMIDAHVLPDSVVNLMPPSWFTDGIVTPMIQAEFDVVSS